MIKMGVYGFRDGKLVLKKLTVQDKMPVQFNMLYVASAFGVGDAILRAWNPNSEGTAVHYNTAFSVQPPYPARLIVYASAAGSAVATQDQVTIKGWNAKGEWKVEDVNVAATAANSHKTNNAFAKVYSIVPDAADHTSSDVNLGWSEIVGLPYQIDSASDILSAQVGYEYATTALTISAQYDTVTLTGLPNASGSTFNLLWMSRVQ